MGQDQPSTSQPTVKAKAIAASTSVATKQTALEEEMAKVSAFRKATGLDKPRAPDGIKDMPVYVTDETQTVTTHTVAKGDTLFSLSKRYQISMANLRSLNGLDGNVIKLGQVLKVTQGPSRQSRIEAPGVRVRVEPLTEDKDVRRVVGPANPSSIQYAVAPGDTLSAISRRTCISQAELVSQNKLDRPDQIVPGQMLTLPSGHCLPR
jgi:membrane-bound lytic murein transglycosylase D